MKTVLCFGDSNTYGYIPGGGRYPKSIRWPGRLQSLLGREYDVIEEGLCGRTTIFPWPDFPWRSGAAMIEPVMESHTPVDYFVLMLGTNDCFIRFNASVQEMKAGIAEIARTAVRICSANQGYAPKVLIVSPAPFSVNYQSSAFAFDIDAESYARSCSVPEIQRAVALENGYAFLEGGRFVRPSDDDSIHLSAEAHTVLAEKIADMILSM